MKKIGFLVANVLIFRPLAVFGQVDFSGYAEAFFQTDSWKKEAVGRPKFLFSHNRADQVAINLAFLKAAHKTEKARASVALMAGTYAADNLAAEPSLFQFVHEAQVGLRLSKKKNLWLDAGIFPSHIGYESAISKDCWSLSRSLMAENSPYYEAGARLTFTSKNEKWTVAGLALNGWQTVFRPDLVPGMAFGSQFQWKNGEKATFNYSNFVGPVAVNGLSATRLFQNAWATFQLTEKWGLTTAFDLGWQEKVGASLSKNWVSASVVARFLISENWRTAVRAELFEDPDFAIIAPAGRPFRARGGSVNLDFLPEKNVALRFEGRLLTGDFGFLNASGQEVFSKKLGSFLTSLAVSF